MSRVLLLSALGVVSFAVSETALAHPHYDVAAVAGNAAALPFLLGIGIGAGIGLMLGISLQRKGTLKAK